MKAFQEYTRRFQIALTAVTSLVCMCSCGPTLVNSLCARPKTTTFQQGSGTTSDPYLICTTTQWQNIESYLSASFLLGADLDFTGITYTPITAFSGSLDGGNHTISNVTVNLPAQSFVGLFSSISGSVSNLTISNATMTSNGGTGALCGRLNGSSSVTNVQVVGGTITSTGVGWYTGGLCGGTDANSDATISNCSSSAAVVGVKYSGGLLGVLTTNAGHSVSVTGSSATGSVNGGASGEAGGLIGYVAFGGTVTQSYATGNVTTAGDYAGGLIGKLYNGTITSCYASGTVQGASYVGGAIGGDENLIAGTVNKVYSTSPTVTATVVGAGGFIGLHFKAVITNSYYRGGSINAAGGWAAGFVAFGSGSGTVSYSYAAATAVAGAGNTGGFMGDDLTGGAMVDENNCFWDNDLVALAGVDGTPKTTAQMKDPATFSAASFSSTIWNLSVSSGAGYMGLR